MGHREGKRPLERHRHTRGDNIKMDIQEEGLWSYGLVRAGPG